MDILQYISSLFQKNGTEYVALSGKCVTSREEMASLGLESLMLSTCVDFMARYFSKSEFKTMENGKYIRGNEWYLWNVQPNINQNASDFRREILKKLYKNGECLIIEKRKELFIADSFSCDDNGMLENVYSSVYVDGESVPGTFKDRNVLHFSVGKSVHDKLGVVYAEYAGLILHSIKEFEKKTGKKGVFEYESLPLGNDKQKEAFDSLINEGIQKFLEADNAVLPLGKGQKYIDLTKTSASGTTRDIRSMFDDLRDYTANAIGIPPIMLSGQASGSQDAIERFMETIDALAKLFADEINRKRYTKKDILSNTQMTIDTTMARHIDPVSNAASLDKLIASSIFSVNDILKMLGQETIAEPWADEHRITKNYALVDDITDARGGESE